MDRLDTKIIKNEEKSNSLENNINQVKTTLEKYTRDFDAIDKNVQEIYVIFKEEYLKMLCRTRKKLILYLLLLII